METDKQNSVQLTLWPENKALLQPESVPAPHVVTTEEILANLQAVDIQNLGRFGDRYGVSNTFKRIAKL